MEARAQEVERDAQQRAQALVDDAMGHSAGLDARERDLAGLAAVLDGRCETAPCFALRLLLLSVRERNRDLATAIR